MATISKTAGASLISLQAVATGALLTSSAQDVSTKLAGTVFVQVGRTVATALSAPVEIEIQASAKASGDDQWYPLVAFKTGIASAADEAVSGTAASGQAVILMASTTGFAVNSFNYAKNTTIGNGEFFKILTVSTNTSVTAEDNLTNAQTGATVYGQAELFAAQVDLTAVTRIRVRIRNHSGQTVDADAFMVTGDSIA